MLRSRRNAKSLVSVQRRKKEISNRGLRAKDRRGSLLEKRRKSSMQVRAECRLGVQWVSRGWL
jgi:hypothetical protein